jgi:hypothetical protein
VLHISAKSCKACIASIGANIGHGMGALSPADIRVTNCGEFLAVQSAACFIFHCCASRNIEYPQPHPFQSIARSRLSASAFSKSFGSLTRVSYTTCYYCPLLKTVHLWRRRMYGIQSLVALVATVSIAQAHTVITYPGWRGNNLHTNGTAPQVTGSIGIDYDSDNGTVSFPYGMQWMYPCK